MLTVLLQCNGQEYELAHSLTALVAGAVEGLVSDVIILDESQSEGIANLADAAGCRYYTAWDLPDVIQSIRGQWILMLEPGARPAGGWTEDLAEYMALNGTAACFSRSRYGYLPWWKRLWHRHPLDKGILISKQQALALVRPGMRLEEMGLGLKLRSLNCEMIGAAALQQKRGAARL